MCINPVSWKTVTSILSFFLLTKDFWGFAVQALWLTSNKHNSSVIAPPASCRSWRPLQPPNNNAEEDDIPDGTLSGRILAAEVADHIIHVHILVLNLKPFLNIITLKFSLHWLWIDFLAVWVSPKLCLLGHWVTVMDSQRFIGFY